MGRSSPRKQKRVAKLSPLLEEDPQSNEVTDREEEKETASDDSNTGEPLVVSPPSTDPRCVLRKENRRLRKRCNLVLRRLKAEVLEIRSLRMERDMFREEWHRYLDERIARLDLALEEGLAEAPVELREQIANNLLLSSVEYEEEYEEFSDDEEERDGPPDDDDEEWTVSVKYERKKPPKEPSQQDHTSADDSPSDHGLAQLPSSESVTSTASLRELL